MEAKTVQVDSDEAGAGRHVEDLDVSPAVVGYVLSQLLGHAPLALGLQVLHVALVLQVEHLGKAEKEKGMN